MKNKEFARNGLNGSFTRSYGLTTILIRKLNNHHIMQKREYRINSAAELHTTGHLSFIRATCFDRLLKLIPKGILYF
ncbi:hypothetical protein [Legionella wadsworthii]|uniref:hypothetical protein n=1 Tax=Legionella wadsworthii TaxID=28088 RepID=UPI000E1BB3D5|nr:hypothetical protein [Legionella wadsworthii]